MLAFIHDVTNALKRSKITKMKLFCHMHPDLLDSEALIWIPVSFHFQEPDLDPSSRLGLHTFINILS